MSDDLRIRIAFSMVRNLNAELAGQLLTRVGDESSLFTKTSSELNAIGRLPDTLLSADYRNDLMRRAEIEERFVLSNDIQCRYFTDVTYPSRLSNCDDGPVMLYQLGCTDLESQHIVAVVGTRHATPYGVDVTSRIVHDLAERLDDLVIVSGLAYGIDVAAHKAALDAGVPTVAVVAHPLNTIYPADHRGVAVQMLRQGGALVSEYSTTDQVHRANFLARNRIVAGLADCTIVVESDTKGGSLVTAGLAQAYNREVFAVPGRLTDRYSRGCIDMISGNRAHIYTGADDLIAEMGWTKRAEAGEQLTMAVELSPHEEQIIEFLTRNPASRINDIMLATEIPAGQLKDLLFNMEMKDLVISMAGGKYSAITT